MDDAVVVFSDIDGTLIDFKTYSYAVVETAVSRLIARRIPLVLCSSKTRVEQAFYREVLHIPDPFIVENGSAIFVPEGYFPFAFAARRVDGFHVIELGVAVETIWQAVTAVRAETGISIQGYHDLTAAAVSRITGLDLQAAENARCREYSETIVTPINAAESAILQAAFARHGLAFVSGGKFHTVMSQKSDKGTAVSHLTNLFRKCFGKICSVGIGDSANDHPLLAAVDAPFLVQKPDGCWQAMPELSVQRVNGIGPHGWVQVVEGIEVKL